jgi:hypothetical protein
MHQLFATILRQNSYRKANYITRGCVRETGIAGGFLGHGSDLDGIGPAVS